MSDSSLFKPLTIGGIKVQHRIAMAPLTRMRATDDRVPTPLMKEYYTQRASTPGTLIITEGTFVTANCGGFLNAPGIWRQDQVEAWKSITDAVHGKDCFIFCQIFAMGRAGNAEEAHKEGFPLVAPSAIPIDPHSEVPEALTLDEVKQMVPDFVHAAQNAMAAGFDGVEIHVANGYILDQFVQDVSNQRSDEYGGSIENRSRIVDEIIRAVAIAIGPECVGMRLSPWSTFQGMRMADPIPQFSDVIKKAKIAEIAYIHLVESRICGSNDATGTAMGEANAETLDFAIDLWDGPILVAGGYTPLEARRLVDERYPGKNVMVVFGRLFLANPDLVHRVKNDLELNRYNRSTFYRVKSPIGYTDYPFCGRLLGERALVTG